MARPTEAVAVGVAVPLAALVMVATLPGRTHGLGLITEPLLADTGLGRLDYASINLWATLIGAAFCVPCGRLIDRFGVRPVTAGLLVGLGLVVLAMSELRTGPSAALVPLVFALVLLTRGLGQSGLSVASLALVGKSTGGRPGAAVGVYSALVAVGFMAAFALVKLAFERWQFGWREVWAGIGVAVLALVPLVLVAARPAGAAAGREEVEDGPTLGAALRTGTFWAFALGSSVYLLAVSGVSLFNQSVLAERGFGRDVFLTITAASPPVGLASNLLTGLLARRVPLNRLLAVALTVLGGALLAFPFVGSLAQVYAYAAAMAVAGGMITVLFFAVWRQAFGTAHLGQIQGAAQMATVAASALGPIALAASHEWTGSYVPAFRLIAAASLALAAFALAVGPNPLPRSR